MNVHGKTTGERIKSRSLPDWVRVPTFTLKGKITLEVKLAPHSSYAFHIEAQSIKGDVKPPLLMFNSASSREIDDIQFN